MTLRKADFGLVEAIAFIALLFYVVAWAKAGALTAGVTLPALPLFKHNYLFFAVTLLMLLWVKLRGETWESLGLKEPASWWPVTGLGVLLFIACVLYSSVVHPSLVQALGLPNGATANVVRDLFGSLRGNVPLFVLILSLTWLFAAFGEEVFYRGYLMTRFAQFMGESPLAWAAAVLAQAALFGVAHSYQGPAGMLGAAMLGVISGAATLLWKRNLWPAIIAHGLVDTLGFTLLFLGLYGER